MRLADALVGVYDRHGVPGEGNHLGAVLDVDVVEPRLSKGFIFGGIGIASAGLEGDTSIRACWYRVGGEDRSSLECS